MEERLEGIMEMKILTMHLCYVLPITIRRDAWQSRVLVRPPVMQHIIIILRLTDLPQVLDAIVGLNSVDMVNLFLGETPVVPNPDGCVVVQEFHFTLIPETKAAIVLTSLAYSLHRLARPVVYEQSALSVVTVVLLDASGQCDQLTLR